MSHRLRQNAPYTWHVETLDITSVQPATRAVDLVSAPPAVRLAYLLSVYPAVSHTFFLHEVLGLRSRGLHIETASINPPDRPAAALPELEAAESAGTFYLKDGRRAAAALKLLGTIFTHPAAFFRGLRAVARIPALTLRQRAFWLLYLAEALLLGRWMKQQRLTHLHVHFGGAVASVGMLTSAAWRIPYSLTIHGPEELLNTASYHLREKVSAASFVFCISDFCRSQLYQLTPPSEWRKFSVIRLGVDPVTLSPPSRQHAVNDPGPRILELVCVGRLVPAKGHRILLEALRLLRERGLRLHLTLIGGGTELPALKQFVLRFGLEDSVTFTSALSHAEALAHVRRANIFALASFAEGIPVALMEAMSLGVPCVSTTIAGIPELIRSGVDGLLVPPANAAALADALESLISDPALRKSLGYSARQRILSQYNLPLNQELLAHSFQARLTELQQPAERRPAQ
jgi:colanic acid/amylovoran biosynthesis glycosyltransferase